MQFHIEHFMLVETVAVAAGAMAMITAGGGSEVEETCHYHNHHPVHDLCMAFRDVGGRVGMVWLINYS